jgi:hypothetical protein
VAPQESGLKDRVPGCDAGKIWMAPDFNAPLPDEIVDPFYE